MKGLFLFICIFISHLSTSSQITFFNAHQCAFGSYPPADGSKIGTYIVNLDLQPKDRWTKLVQDKKPQIIQLIDNIKNISETFFHGKLIHLVDKFLPYLAKTLPAPFYEELEGIAQATGIPLGINENNKVLSILIDYESFPSSGEIFHARNMDFGLLLGWDIKNQTWTSTEILRKMVVNTQFQKNGETVYHTVQFAGYIGILTAMKPGLFSLTIDERFKLKGGYIGVIEWILGYRTGSWMGFLARQVMESAESYSEAQKILSDTRLLSPVYFILSGNKTGEGCIITRDFTSADVWPLGTGNSTWFLVQTNYDHWSSPPFFDDRRTPTIECMNKLSQDKLSLSGLFDVLTSKPALNKLTVYTALMQASTDQFESYLQDCQEPCMPW